MGKPLELWGWKNEALFACVSTQSTFQIGRLDQRHVLAASSWQRHQLLAKSGTSGGLTIGICFVRSPQHSESHQNRLYSRHLASWFLVHAEYIHVSFQKFEPRQYYEYFMEYSTSGYSNSNDCIKPSTRRQPKQERLQKLFYYAICSSAAEESNGEKLKAANAENADAKACQAFCCKRKVTWIAVHFFSIFWRRGWILCLWANVVNCYFLQTITP